MKVICTKILCTEPQSYQNNFGEFQIATLVCKVEGQVKPIAFRVVGRENVAICQQLQVDIPLQVEFSVESREWNGKYYTDINFHGVQIVMTSNNQQQ